MTSPRPTDLNFALPPGFVPAVRPVPAPAAPVRKVVAPAAVPTVRRIEPPAPAPAIETSKVLPEPKPRAARKPRAATTKVVTPKVATPKVATPKVATPKTAPAKPAAAPTPTRRRSTPAVADIVEQEAGRILEDAARTAADMLAAARSTAARLGADLAAEQAQRRREMGDAVADLADYLDALAHRLRTGAPLSVE
jgi:hypothetical protein